MAFGYDVRVNDHDGSYTLVRHGQTSRGVAELTLVLGLLALVATAMLTILVAQSDDLAPLPFVFLFLSGIPLSLAAHGFGWERACGSMLVSQPRRLEIESSPPCLRIGRQTTPLGDVVRLVIQQVPIAKEEVGETEYRFVVAIILRWQVIELTFDDPASARDVARELVGRLGVGEPVLGMRPMFRAYGLLLVIPILLGISAPLAVGVWAFVRDTINWQTTLLSIGAVLLANVGVFLLTWWWGKLGARTYLEKEYGVWLP